MTNMRKLKQQFKLKIWWPLMERFVCRGNHNYIRVPANIMYPVEPYYCKWCRDWKGYKECYCDLGTPNKEVCPKHSVKK